ncbi:MAG: hypothetical protein Q9162_001078 [Coniocarpon cinnabarinum]
MVASFCKASLLCVLAVPIPTFFVVKMIYSHWPTYFASIQLINHASTAAAIDLNWYPPADTQVSSLASAINGTGVNGFIFNSSQTPPSVPYAGTYNWCNMPHVRQSEYPAINSSGLQLSYVEVIHRHHKRTPYAANTFPTETYPWYCNNTALYYFGSPRNPPGNASAETYWSVFTDPSNPFQAPGFPGDCEFPQLTRGGLDDAWQHGRDLFEVYSSRLGLSMDSVSDDSSQPGVSFRVTNNVITSQVAGMVLNGMFSVTKPFPLSIQPDSIDSLEPTYSCPAADGLKAQYGVGSNDLTWASHLAQSASLVETLDQISGVSASATDWHQSWDHYFDNLSSRLCHGKPLPCNSTTGACVTEDEANEVFRLGEWEYSWMYRAAGPKTLQASVASYGVWIAELNQHLRQKAAGDPGAGIYRHNVAHDGSIAPLLSILQVSEMVWPGMGAEVVFELYQSKSAGNDWFVRILWGGQVLNSSSPMLNAPDGLILLDTLLAYFDGLVGPQASLIPGRCSA